MPVSNFGLSRCSLTIVLSPTVTSGQMRVPEWTTTPSLSTTRGPMMVSFSMLQSSPITVSVSMTDPLTVQFLPTTTRL